MKKVYFIRHAKSSWADSSLRDIDRPLNKRGLRDAPFMAKLLKAKQLKVDAIIASPANRAWTTAMHFADAFDIPERRVIQKEEIYEAWMETILEIVQELPSDWNTVLIFGHNPTFTSLANHFSEDYIPNVPTCGIVEISGDVQRWADFNAQTARRTAFHFPKQYFT